PHNNVPPHSARRMHHLPLDAPAACSKPPPIAAKLSGMVRDMPSSRSAFLEYSGATRMCQELLSWRPRESQSRVALLQRALWEPCALDGEGRAIGSTELPGFARRLAAGARSEVLRSAPP